jgi:uncharacterized membrane protein (DUF373 family)
VIRGNACGGAWPLAATAIQSLRIRVSTVQTLIKLWRNADVYHRFELILSVIVIFTISIIACFAIARLAWTMINLLILRLDIIEPTAFQTLFGMIFIVLITLEFNRTIIHSLSNAVGTAQIKGVILIAIMVVVRKLIVSDPKEIMFETVLGLAALLLALGLVYFLVSWRHRKDDLE